MKSIRSKLFFVLLCISAAGSMGLYAWYYYLKTTAVPTAQEKLKKITKARSNAIILYLNHKEKQLSALVKQERIKKLFTSKETVPKQMEKFIFSFEKEAGFINTLLISPTGVILYSSQKPSLQNVDLSRPKYKAMSGFVDQSNNLVTEP